MPRLTVRNNETGQNITFDWNMPTPPTQADLEEVFAAAGQGATPQVPQTPEAPPTPETPGPMARGWKEFKEQAIPSLSDIGDMGKQLFLPTGIPMPNPQGVTNMVKGILGQQWGEIQKGRELTEKPGVGNQVQAIGRMAAGALPVIGPAAAHVGEHFEKGEIAEGVGGTAGLLAPFGVGGAGRQVKATKPVGKVPLTYSERTGSGASKFFETIGERSLGGVNKFQKFRASQQTAMIDGMAEDAVKQVSMVKGTPHQVGEAMQDALTTSKAKLETVFRKGYEDIDNQLQVTWTKQQVPAGSAPGAILGPDGKPAMIPQFKTVNTPQGPGVVDTRPLKAMVAPLLEDLERAATIIPPQELQRGMNVLKQIIEGPEFTAFATMHDAKSMLAGLARSVQNEPAASKLAGLLKKTEEGVYKAMMDAADNSGIPGIAAKVQSLDAAYKEFKFAFNKTVVAKLLGVKGGKVTAPAERVHAFLSKASVDDIKTVKDLLPPDIYQASKAMIARDLLNEAIRGEVSGGWAGQSMMSYPGQAMTELRTLKGDLLLSAMEKLNKGGQLHALFTPQEIQGLTDVANMAKRIAGKGSGLTPGLIAGTMNLKIVGPVMSLMFGLPVGIGASAVLYTGLRVMSHMFVHPEGIKWIRQYVRALGSNNVELAAVAGNQISKLAERLSVERSDTPTPNQPQEPETEQKD